MGDFVFLGVFDKIIANCYSILMNIYQEETAVFAVK